VVAFLLDQARYGSLNGKLIRLNDNKPFGEGTLGRIDERIGIFEDRR
jgi:hypothetical protein